MMALYMTSVVNGAAGLRTEAMSALKKPVEHHVEPLDVARVNAALRASGIDYQADGKVDARAFARAFGKRFPKTMAKLAE